MSNNKSQIQKYPLLPFSRLVYEEIRWRPDVYTMSLCLLWHGGAKVQEKVENALRMTLVSHHVFQMRIDCRGRHYQSRLKDVLHGKYHDFTFSTQGDDLILNIHFNRILGDGASLSMCVNDFIHVYNGGVLDSDRYWDYLEFIEQQKKTQKYRECGEWLKKEYADNNIPVHPTIDRLWIKTIWPLKLGVFIDDYTESQIKFERFQKDQLMSYEAICSLCTALAIAEYCGTDAAALTWAYGSREQSAEQRIFGSLHRDIPFCIRKSKIENRKSDLIRQARNQIRSGIAHSDYPYTLTKPYTKRWNYAVNVLRNFDVDTIPSLMPNFPIEVISSTSQKYAYALLDVEIHETSGSLKIVYRYSATHYKESSIKKFAALVRKYTEWLLEE